MEGKLFANNAAGFSFVGTNSNGELVMNFNKDGKAVRDCCPTGTGTKEEKLHIEELLKNKRHSGFKAIQVNFQLTQVA